MTTPLKFIRDFLFAWSYWWHFRYQERLEGREGS